MILLTASMAWVLVGLSVDGYAHYVFDVFDQAMARHKLDLAAWNTRQRRSILVRNSVDDACGGRRA